MSPRQGTVPGLVLSDRHLHRVGADGEVVTLPLDPPLRPGEDPSPALHRALAWLEGVGADPEGVSPQAPDPDGEAVPEPGPIRVALLPPLVETRFVSLPPLRPHEARAVLRRDASRHFMGAGRGPLLVAVGPHDREGGGRLAAALPEALAETLLAILRGRGYEPEALVAAHGGWVAAGKAAGATLVVADPGPGPLHLLELREGMGVRVRRVEPGDPVGPPGEEGRRALSLVEDRERDGALRGALLAAGWEGVSGSTVPGLGSGPASAEGPSPLRAGILPRASLAAAAGKPEEALAFLPASLAARLAARERSETRRLALLAGLLLLVAAATHGWGAQAELRAVEEARRDHAEAVAPVLALRDSLDRMEARLASLRTLEASTPRWSFPLVELSMLLPPETHAVGLRLAGDTLAVDGEGGRAGDLLAALRGSSSFRDPLLEGSIQRTLDRGGGGGGERFTVSALLRRPGGGLP